ncbi:MAG TPA: glycosyltransferase [Bryobacteraceae bacterium]|nr:glycosyltransferase [Bryobacteraceae bacterium]
MSSSIDHALTERCRVYPISIPGGRVVLRVVTYIKAAQLAHSLTLHLVFRPSGSVASVDLLNRDITAPNVWYRLVFSLQRLRRICNAVLKSRRASLVGLLFDFHSLKGHHVPLRAAFATLEARRRRAFILDGWLLLRFPGLTKIYSDSGLPLIIGGLHCFEYDITFRFIKKWRGQIFVYLQEAGDQFARFRQHFPERYQETMAVLQRCQVLAASEKQAHTLGEWGINAVTLVGECIDVRWITVATDHRQRSHIPTIAMVGTIQNRKGPEFFDSVASKYLEADEARFIWIGSGTFEFRSVHHIGPALGRQLEELWSRMDILFLSSWDEVFGLCVVEALIRGIPAVCWRGVGASEMLYQVGLREYVFDQYQPESAIAAIRAALNNPVPPDVVIRVWNQFARPETLWRRIESIVFNDR